MNFLLQFSCSRHLLWIQQRNNVIATMRCLSTNHKSPWSYIFATTTCDWLKYNSSPFTCYSLFKEFVFGGTSHACLILYSYQIYISIIQPDTCPCILMIYNLFSLQNLLVSIILSHIYSNINTARWGHARQRLCHRWWTIDISTW